MYLVAMYDKAFGPKDTTILFVMIAFSNVSRVLTTSMDPELFHQRGGVSIPDEFADGIAIKLMVSGQQHRMDVYDIRYNISCINHLYTI